jgi:hypothetical protein
MLGFELSHTAHQKGELAKEITGVEGADIKSDRRGGIAALALNR